jgi:hypothetical protein
MAKQDPSVKQGAVSARDVRALAGRRLRVEGLRGTFKDVRFGEDHVSQGPVSPTTEKSLRAQFGEMVEEVKEESEGAETEDDSK